MAKIEKIGRRASKEDRARAAGLVASYRRALSSPGSCYCMNPEDEPGFQIFIDGTDVEPLLEALQDFAVHGTFALIGDGQPLFIHMEYRALRDEGKHMTSVVSQRFSEERELLRLKF